MVKNLSASAGDARDVGSNPGSGRSPGGGRDNLLQYFCLENPMDRGTWQATVHRVAKSQTQLSKITYLIYYNIGSVLCFQFFGNKAYGILAPQPGIEPIPPTLEGKILTTGPAGKS